MDPALPLRILSILEVGQNMTVATIRPDGYPQATTVSFVNDGLVIYFGCAETSQKARNIARNNKISLTINAAYSDWSDICGLSMGGRCTFQTQRSSTKSRSSPQEISRNCQIRFARSKRFGALPRRCAYDFSARLY
jgi:general stress protein 26